MAVGDIILNQAKEVLIGQFQTIRDETLPGANTAKRIGKAFIDLLEFIQDNQGHFIRKDIEDTAQKVITFLEGVILGNFTEGVSGGRIDEAGNAEFNRLVARGEAVFKNNLSSEVFESGFLNGRGWSIFRQRVANAAGILEDKYTAEFDNLIIRGSLRVFELVVSQMLGENDNRVFAAMMEVDYYDAISGRVYFDNKDGEYYNPFRHDDVVEVHQFNGHPSEENDYYVTKSYELVIDEVYSGTENGKRVDWVTFKNFVSLMESGTPLSLITRGDTFCRVDNLSDPNRKGIMQIMSVGPHTPYMDVLYGKKTDPDHALKGRWGNLEGIRHPYWGWLEGYGEYLCNLYGIGDFLLKRTGESVDQQISMLKGLFSTQFQRESYELTDADNYLYNSSFLNDMEGWTVDNDNDLNIVTIGAENSLFITNGSTVATGEHVANVEEYDGKQMLRIKNVGITQANSLIRKPATHKEYLPSADDDTSDEFIEVQDTIYLTIKFLPKTDGLLTIGFKYDGEYDAALTNTLPYTDELPIERSDNWIKLEWKGTWHGLGDFYLKYTGEMYVSLLSVTCEDIDEFKKTTETRILQDDRNIQLLGLNIDKTNKTVTELGIELRAADNELRLYVNQLAENYYTKAEIDVTVGNINLTVSNLRSDIDEKFGYYYTKSEIDVTVDSIEFSVAKLNDDLVIGLSEVNKQIADANAAIDETKEATADLEDYINGAFEDGIIDQAEKIAIEKHLSTIESTKKDVDSTYTVLSGNSNLPSAQLSNLTSAKSSLNTYYTSLVNTINSVISDGLATESEVTSVKTAFKNFNDALGVFSQRVQECHKAIEAALKEYTDTLKQQALDYADKVSAPEYIESSTNPYSSWSSTTEAKKHLGLLWKYTGTSSITTYMIPDATGSMRPGINGHVYRYVGFSGDNKWEDVTENSTSVALTKNYGDKIVTVVSQFDENGYLTECSGQTLTAYGNSLWASKSTVSALDGIVAQHTTKIENNASAISLKASTEYVNDLSGRIGELQSEILATSEEISLKVSADNIISAINMTSESVKISSSKIQLEGYTTINSSFSVDTNGVTRIGGFKVSGNGLTNDPFTNDAYVIFRNDTHNCFAGIGGNILPSSTGLRGVARFENEDESDWWALGTNYAMLLSAKNAVENVAINIAGGHIRGLALKTQIIGLDTIIQSSEPGTRYVTIERGVTMVLASTQYTHKTSSSASGSVKQRNVYLTLPTMYDYDDGHVIFIKRGSSDSGNLTISQGDSYHREGSGNSYYSTFFIIDNDVETSVSFKLAHEGEACMLVYFRDLTWTSGTQTYKGAWVQWKLPRDW